MAQMIPIVDVKRTGQNIYHLMQEQQVSIKDVQEVCGFTTPQAIYKWLNGKNLPTIDNLVILACLLHCTIDDIIIVVWRIEKRLGKRSNI